jgi:hypothetical protein
MSRQLCVIHEYYVDIIIYTGPPPSMPGFLC